MKVMRENPKTFQAAVQSALAEQNLQNRFQLKSNDHDDPKRQNSGTNRNTSHKTSEEMFLMSQGGTFDKTL